jgi:hypothetical protein
MFLLDFDNFSPITFEDLALFLSKRSKIIPIKKIIIVIIPEILNANIMYTNKIIILPIKERN